MSDRRAVSLKGDVYRKLVAESETRHGQSLSSLLEEILGEYFDAQEKEEHKPKAAPAPKGENSLFLVNLDMTVLAVNEKAAEDKVTKLTQELVSGRKIKSFMVLDVESDS